MLQLTDLPAELKEKIANVLDYKSKMSLRQVTKDFKEAVDNSEFFYDSLTLNWSSSWRNIFLTLLIKSEGIEIRKDLKFGQSSNRFTVKNYAEKWEKTVVRADFNYIDAAMDHFWKILNHRNRAKIHLNSIFLTIPRHFLEATEDWVLGDMRQFNEKFNQKNKTKLSVKELQIEWNTDPEFHLNAISLVRPGILEEMTIGHSFDFTKIAETDQYKQAKRMQFIDLPPNLDTSHISDLTWQKEKVELEEMKELVDQFFLNPNWKRRHIANCSFDRVGFENHFFEPGHTGGGVIRRGRDACRLQLENTSIENRNIIIDRVTE